MTKKNKELDEWHKMISDSFKKDREKERLITPRKGRMRYLKDYTNSLSNLASRMNIVWDLLEADILTQEHAQTIMDNHVEEMAEQINEIIGHLEVDRERFHTHNYDDLSHHQGVLTLHQLKRGIEEGGGDLVFSVAIKEDMLYKDETHIANFIDDTRLPKGIISYSVLNWTIDYVLKDHIILRAILREFEMEEELKEKIMRY